MFFQVQDGATFGMGIRDLKLYNRADYTYTSTMPGLLLLALPPHTALSRSYVDDITSEGATDQQIILFTESDWSLTNIPEWVHF